MRYRVKKLIEPNVNFGGQIKILGIWMTVKYFVYYDNAMEWLNYKKNGNKYYY
jgi:hypothetical protein